MCCSWFSVSEVRTRSNMANILFVYYFSITSILERKKNSHNLKITCVSYISVNNVFVFKFDISQSETTLIFEINKLHQLYGESIFPKRRVYGQTVRTNDYVCSCL